MSCAPFIDQNVCDLIESKELPSIFRAHCDKIGASIQMRWSRLRCLCTAW